MDANSQRHRDVTFSTLNAAIEAMNLAKEAVSITSAKAVFGSVSIILTMIRVSFLLVHLDQPQANGYRIL
jgi:predicted metal-dependent hydrolase